MKSASPLRSMSSQSKKPLCEYKEKCYRRKTEHFEQYDHPHLNTFLENTGITIPKGIQLKTSPQTLLVQLGIVDKLRNGSSSSNGNSLPQTVTKSEAIFQEEEVLPCSSQSLSRKRQASASPSNSSQSSPCGTPSKKTTSSQYLQAMRQSLAFIQQNSQRIFISIEEKWKASAPYYILYTGLDSSPDRYSIIFSELLDSSFGVLESSLLLNFMIEFGWILACYQSMGCRAKPMTLLYGQCDEELDSRFSHFLTADLVKPPSSFGSHHTKMMIFSYVDGSIRVVVCTANLVESDWSNRTQGVWISPKCEKLPEDAPDTSGDSETNFKTSLLRYLKKYQLQSLQTWIDKVQRADMSHIKVVFVASVPGSHSPTEGWGQNGVKVALRRFVPPPESSEHVIAQCSSIGSLGPQPSSYLEGQILKTLSTNNRSHDTRLPIHVIYPSFRDVEASANGILGGGCLPYSSAGHAKQPWLHEHLRRWKSDKINRTKAVPHIKTYTRVTGDEKQAAYFLLTSANLSKAAWGNYNKSGGLSILSYEAGVLLLPKFLIGENYFPLTSDSSSDSFGESKPVLRLPYDLPLINYSDTDVPWFIDNLM